MTGRFQKGTFEEGTFEEGGFRFRLAESRDVPALVELRLQFMRLIKDGGLPDEVEWRAELSELFSADLLRGSFLAWLAFDSNLLVATSGLAFPAADDPQREELDLKPGEALLCNMFTLPRYRRRGLATRFLGLCFQEARSLGAASIVAQPTADSLALYLSQGFGPYSGLNLTEKIMYML